MNLFNEKNIQLNVTLKTKHDLFEFLAETLQKDMRITSKEHFLEGLWARENEISTGIGDGLAIPHAKDASVIFPTLLFIRLNQPIEYHALDSKPIDIVFLIAMPSSYHKEHLELLSKLATFLLKDDNQSKIRSCENEASIHQLISENIKP